MGKMQLPDDFSEFLRLLDVHDVPYLIVGGYAVAFHGYPRATQDLDVWVNATEDVGVRLVTALHEFGFEDAQLTPELFTDPDRLVRLGIPPMRLEILSSVSGLAFDDSLADAVRTDVDGVPVTVVSLADLRRNKLAAGRPRDLADLEELPES